MEHLLTTRYPLTPPPGYESTSQRFKGRTPSPLPSPEVRALLLRRDFHVGLLVPAMDLVAAVIMEVRHD
jgi:hypothetical protein